MQLMKTSPAFMRPKAHCRIYKNLPLGFSKKIKTSLLDILKVSGSHQGFCLTGTGINWPPSSTVKGGAVSPLLLYTIMA